MHAPVELRLLWPAVPAEREVGATVSRYNGMHVNYGVFERPMGNGLTLRKHVDEGSGPIAETHAFVGPAGEVLEERRDWDWADLHRGRLLYASEGVLYAAPIRDGTPTEPSVVTDLNRMTFRNVSPPYAALNRED